MITQQMTAPAWASGTFSCTAPGQSGATYYVSAQVGGSPTTVDIDIRDVPSFLAKGFVKVGDPSES